MLYPFYAMFAVGLLGAAYGASKMLRGIKG